MLLPLKQGLKLLKSSSISFCPKSCYATSIKTRIETKERSKKMSKKIGCYATSIKTRIETPFHNIRQSAINVVMLLPLKQGLKHRCRE